MDIPALLSTGQAAQRLGVSVSYLNKLRLSDDGPPFVKLGARVAYDPADLTVWIEGRKQRSTGGGLLMAQFPDDAVRARIVELRSAAFAASYLDPAAWEPSTRTITARTEVARRKLCELELRTAFAELGVSVYELADGGH